ncbi:hypothetical protein [Hahella ganghwensis]|uniref:hypothetical protein n=1 Tax=Hahella ganghwensis TaxID=286420 RepID=UPI000361AC04|nr:hypothetical protein [Hahella ganghwensis]
MKRQQTLRFSYDSDIDTAVVSRPQKGIGEACTGIAKTKGVISQTDIEWTIIGCWSVAQAIDGSEGALRNTCIDWVSDFEIIQPGRADDTPGG